MAMDYYSRHFRGLLNSKYIPKFKKKRNDLLYENNAFRKERSYIIPYGNQIIKFYSIFETYVFVYSKKIMEINFEDF